MGFGLLFFACFLTYFGALVPAFSIYFYVVGSAFMLYALYKLSNQNKLFFVSTLVSLVFLILSIVIVALSVFAQSSGALYRVLIYAQTVLAPVLLIVVMAAVFIIAKEVELRKIQGWSIVNTALIVIAMIFEIVSMFVNSGEAIARLGLVWIILRVLYSAFTLVILFNCYARICYEDDADMEKSATGMPVFDTLNRMLDKATKKKDGNNKKEDK